MRLVVDTNIWIHYLIQRPPKSLDALLLSQSTELLFSRELIEEFLDVCSRPKFVRYFSQEEVSELLLLLESRFPPIPVFSSVEVCRDKKDNFLLTLCKDGNADYLITGDSDLLALRQFESTRIITLKEFSTIEF